MARIAILLDGEPSHLWSTILLARNLAERGHTVWYLGLQPIANAVNRQGFQFIRIFGEVLSHEMTTTPSGVAVSGLFQSISNGGSLREALNFIEPDLIITLSAFCLVGVIVRVAFDIPVVLLRTHSTLLSRGDEIRRIVNSGLVQSCGNLSDIIRLFKAVNIEIKRLADLHRLALAIPELILLPKQFALPEQIDLDDGAVYVGPGIACHYVPSFPWRTLNITGRIVYCSLGSRPDLEWETSRRFFEVVIQAISQRPEFHLLLSTGGDVALERQLNCAAPNIFISPWLPQLEVLDRSIIAITHGGLNTIKECILMGVPMLVFPVLRDQFSGAARVEQLRLGMRGDIRYVSVEELSGLLDVVTRREQPFADSVSAMQKVFHESQMADGIRLIEQLALSPYCPKPGTIMSLAKSAR